MNCDRIAPLYELIERAAFGGRLQKHRELFLRSVQGKQRVLILGDGDGRFTRALANAYPAVEIDSVEMSAGMISQAHKRLRGLGNVKLICCDALALAFRPAAYDIVFTHFFLDCFDTQTVDKLAERLSASLTCGGAWIVSDFRQAQEGWKRLFTELWLFTMYRFFKLATGLTTNHLPEHAQSLASAGFTKLREHVSFAGLIASEWWQLSATSASVEFSSAQGQPR